MALCNYLTGENIRPKNASEARDLIGKRVKYLKENDIDKTGRGLFFPKYGTIVEVRAREIAMDVEGNFNTSISSIVEMVLIESSVKVSE